MFTRLGNYIQSLANFNFSPSAPVPSMALLCFYLSISAPGWLSTITGLVDWTGLTQKLKSDYKYFVGILIIIGKVTCRNIFLANNAVQSSQVIGPLNHQGILQTAIIPSSKRKN